MNKLKSLWNKLPDSAKRVVHTFYQSFLSVFVLGITGIYSGVVSVHSLSDAKSALIALLTAAIAAALSAVKSMVTVKQAA